MVLPGESTSFTFLLLVTDLVIVAEGTAQDREVSYLRSRDNQDVTWVRCSVVERKDKQETF